MGEYHPYYLGGLLTFFLAVRQRRHLREGRRLRPPRSHEDGAQPDDRIPGAEVGTSETDDLAQDLSRVVERGWLEIGLEVLGESLFLFSFFFFMRWLYANMVFQAGLPSL